MAGGDGTRVDLHVKILDAGVIERAKAHGVDVLVYAPHFEHISTIRERAARFSDDDLLVVPAREYFTGPWHDRKHVLAVDPDAPVPDFIGFEDTMAELADMDAAVLAPHPEFLTLSVDRDDIERYRDVFDAVEVYNPKHWPWDDRRARAVGAAVDLPVYASSYAHLTRTVGAAYVDFERDIDSAGALVAALREGAPRTLHHRTGPGYRLWRRVEFCHLGWENTWKKFERVVLTDLEPTNPFHPDYGGEFEDRSCY